MLRISLLTLTLLSSFTSFGNTENNKVEAQNLNASSCFANVKLEPSFIAFNTTKGSSLANWYKQLFTLKTAKAFAFPDGKTTGILMNKGDFVIEVFFREDILIKEEQVPTSSITLWAGTSKVGIFTNAELPTLQSCLKKNGVNAGRIWRDKNLPINLLQVTDPDGNTLEIISRQ